MEEFVISDTGLEKKQKENMNSDRIMCNGQAMLEKTYISHVKSWN